MKQNRKAAYLEKRVDDLREEASGYKEEIKALERELAHTKAELRRSEDAYQRLKESYEKYMFDYSERIEQLTEARIAYENGLREIRKTMKDYKAEAMRWISEIKKTGKAV